MIKNIRNLYSCQTNKIFILGFIFLSSCSLMFNGGSQSMRMEGERGVKVLITTSSGSYEDELPTTVVAKSSYSGVEVKVIDEKYNTTSQIVNKSIAASFFANIFNAVGFVIDGVVGSFWNYDDVTHITAVKKDN